MRKIFSILFALVLVLSFSLVATTPVAAATPIYVDAARPDDSGDGTSPATAKKTIQAGINVVDVGGTVIVAAGTYNEEVEFDNTRDGITLSGANAGIPGTGARGAESIIEWNNVVEEFAINILDGADGVVIDGFTVKAGDDIFNVRSDDVVIKNNIVTPSTSPVTTNAPGIFACECDNLTVSYNWILDIGSGGGCGMFLGLNSWTADITNSLIEHNLIENSGGAGILFNYCSVGSANTVEYNEIKNVGHDGIRTANSHDVSILHNEIYGSARDGVRTVTNADHTINNNSIYNSVGYGVNNLDVGTTLDASCNWWGTNTAAGVATEVSTTYVDYTPWLDSGTDTDPGPGFQGDLSVLNVDDDSPQTGATGRIQEGVDEVTASTVNVAAGTYNEQVTITKSLDLIGAGEGSTTIQAPISGRSTVSQPNPGYSDIVWDYVVAAYPSSGTIDVKIQGFTVDANGQDGSSTRNFAGVFLRDIGDGTDDGLYSCTVNNFGSYGVSSNYWSGTYGTWMGNYGVIIYDDSELTVDDCDIDDYSVSGISAKGTDVDLTITSNDLDGTDSNYVGLFLRDGVATITDNNIYNHDGVGENMGIYLYDAANGVIIDDSVGANTIADNYIGLFLKGTSGATIDGNTFTNNLLRSIVIQQDSDNNAVTGNTITMVTGTVDAGIVIGSDSGGNVIGGDTPADGNSITLPTDGGGPRYCIWLSAVDTGDVTIKNNTINGGQRAVQFDGGPGHSGTNTVSDNTISGSVFGGIMSNCHGDFVISGNTISGTDRPLEFWQGGNGNIVITLNTLSSTAYDAINAGSYASMNISYNNLECLAGGWGVNNRMTTQIDARYNWWGDASGPSGGATDPVTATIATGSGEVVGTSPYVRFDPWTGKTASVSTTTGTGTASFTSSAGAVENVTAVATPPGAPVLPDGVFSFKVTGLTSGQTITITIVLPGPVLPVGSAKWWKYQAGAWYSLPIGSDDGDNIITITLTDGVFPGDEDSIAGQITDPGGLGYLVSACRLDISSTEGGSVTTPGEGTYTRYCGTGVSLVATAATGYHFVNWTGDVGTIADVHDASTTITMRGWYSITANFESGGNPQAQGEYTLTISSTAGGSVTSPGEGNSAYEAGTMVNLVASPDDGYEFVDWTGDGITNPDSATTTVTMNGDYSIKASFDFEETTSANPAEGSSGSLGCFIATAAYGTPTAEQIDVLREFRDVVLLESTAGSQFIALYYQLSPPIADFIAGSNFLRTLVRELLVDPVVWVVEATGAMWRN